MRGAVVLTRHMAPEAPDPSTAHMLPPARMSWLVIAGLTSVMIVGTALTVAKLTGHASLGAIAGAAATAVLGLIAWQVNTLWRASLADKLAELRAANEQLHQIHAPMQDVAERVQFLEGAVRDMVSVLERHRATSRAISGGLGGLPAAAAAAAAATAHERQVNLTALLDQLPDAFHSSTENLGRVSRIVRAVKG